MDIKDPAALLVDADWLWEHRDDPELRLIDCGSTDCSSSDAYDRAHLPGALHLPVHGWLKEPEFGVHVIGPDECARVMTGLGVSSDTTVVVYDDFNTTFATRLWWVLTYYGHPDVRVLDGGFRRWLREARPLSNESVPTPEGTFDARADAEMVCHLEDVRTGLGDPEVQIVNALWEEWYRGECSLPRADARRGHLPGSLNVPVERFLTDGDVPSFRSIEECRAIVDTAGLDPSRQTLIHCWAGVRTTLVFFALARLGWTRLRAYDASLAEWATQVDTPLTVS
jgi:thiosulfate/3-mercaptopyruvate sulfurtransferase